MGWHCITVWECGLTPARRENTLEMLVAVLNRFYLQDHGFRPCDLPAESPLMAAEEMP